MTPTLRLSLVATLLLFACALTDCSSHPEECVRAVDCVRVCGGPVIQSGCDACPSGSFDDLLCRVDASPGSSDASSDGG